MDQHQKVCVLLALISTALKFPEEKQVDPVVIVAV